MNPTSSLPVTIEPARPEDLEPAFRLIFSRPHDEDVEARVANALQLVRRGELDSAGILVARGERGLIGALVCQLSPGASGLLWPPQVLATANRTWIEDQLLLRAVSWLRQQGAKLGQTLLEPLDHPLAEPLLRHGFRHITNLWYMRHTLSPLPRYSERVQELVFRPYEKSDPRLFHETLLRTYEGSTDCPEVNGIRTVEEIIAGHQAQETFNPERWHLLLEGGCPVGVLLIAEVPDWHGWDLAYLGVVPEARRRGLGRAATVHVLREAWKAKQVQVTLSVDTRNQAAWNLYRELGFLPFDQRQVYLAVWNSSAS